MSDINKKVEHVRAAKQTRHHTCHWPGCDVQCPPAKWGCTRHWYMLPENLRRRIWLAYEIGQEITLTPSNKYIEIAREVQEWIKKNYPLDGR